MSRALPRSALSSAAVSGTLSTTGRCRPRLAWTPSLSPSTVRPRTSRPRNSAAHPIDVAALGAIGVVACADAGAERLEGWQRIDAPLGVDAGLLTAGAPVGAVQEVHEVDAQGLFGLVDLPVVRAGTVQVLAELLDAVGGRPVVRRARQELADEAHAIGCGRFLVQASLEQELAELLE